MKLVTLSLATVMLSLTAFASSENNLAVTDVTFVLSNGQTARIVFKADPIKSGPKSDNPFTMTVWNTGAGSDHKEDLKDIQADPFKFWMPEMAGMPDPSKVYKKPRIVKRTDVGTYSVSQALFTMGGDWQIDLNINGKSVGHAKITVSDE